jgi:hypothetical protein
MVKAGDEIWSVLMADFVVENRSPEFRAEFTGSKEEDAVTYMKAALEEFFYDKTNHCFSFPECSAAVNAFVDGSSTSFDEDLLNWREQENSADKVKMLGDVNSFCIFKVQNPRGETQFDCFSKSKLLASFVLQHSFVEE